MEECVVILSVDIKPNKENKYALFTIGFYGHQEQNIFGEFPNQNSNFRILEYENLNDTNMRKSATELLYSTIRLLDS